MDDWMLGRGWTWEEEVIILGRSGTDAMKVGEEDRQCGMSLFRSCATQAIYEPQTIPGKRRDWKDMCSIE